MSGEPAISSNLDGAELDRATPEFADLSKKLSRFDGVVSLLFALIVVIGLVVLVLTAVYVSNVVFKIKTEATPVTLIKLARPVEEDGPEGAEGDNPDIGDAPMLDAANQEPRLENLVFDQPEITDVMNTVLDAAAEIPTDISEAMPKEGKGGGREGAPGGTGKVGVGEGSSAVPRALRWSIHYPAGQTMKSYARTLDFFGIELGIVRPGGRATYVSRLSAATPTTRQGGGNETRLYFAWQDKARRQADLDLLKSLKIPSAGGQVVQFIPPPLEQRMADLELRAAGGKRIEEIRQTRFGVRTQRAGYELHVLAQTFVK